MKMLYVLVMASCVLSISACSKNKNKGAPPENKDLVTYRFDNFKLSDKANASASLMDLGEKIQKGQAVSFKQISSEMRESHRLEYEALTGSNVPSDEVAEFIQNVSSGVSTENMFQMKTDLEKNLVSLIGGEIFYNSESVTVVHPLKVSELQCYSGTYLYQLVLRGNTPGKDFTNQHHVVVYESGHVLPGFMVQRNGDWYLFGVEMTATDSGLRFFGLAKDLREQQVVRADYYAIMELYKNALVDTVALRDEMLSRTAEQYDIDLSQFVAPRAGSPGGSAKASGSASIASANGDDGSSSSLLNASPFGFGVANVKPGRKKRAKTSGIGGSTGSVGVNGQTDIEHFLPADISKSPGQQGGVEVTGIADSNWRTSSVHMRWEFDSGCEETRSENSTARPRTYQDPHWMSIEFVLAMMVEDPWRLYVMYCHDELPNKFYMGKTGERETVLENAKTGGVMLIRNNASVDLLQLALFSENYEALEMVSHVTGISSCFEERGCWGSESKELRDIEIHYKKKYQEGIRKAFSDIEIQRKADPMTPEQYEIEKWLGLLDKGIERYRASLSWITPREPK